MSNIIGESTLKETLSRFFASVIYFLGLCVISIMNHHGIIALGDLWLERLCAMCVYGSIVSFIVEIILENLGQKKLKLRLVCHALTYVVLQVN